MDKIKIGITIHLGSDNESMFINGIKMNAIFLAKVLKKIGHDVILLDTGEDVKKPFTNKVSWDIDKFPISKFKDSVMDQDLLITLGTVPSDQVIEKFKSKRKSNKVIAYQCGNSYVLDMEISIFKEGDLSPTNIIPMDQIWYIPQQHYQNKDYYYIRSKSTKESDVKQVPFIWDPMFLDENSSYKPGQLKKDEARFSIFEPNINVVKFCLPSILGVEEFYRNGGKYKNLNVFAAEKLFQSPFFKRILATLDILGAGKIKLEKKYSVVDTLRVFTDVVLSHQWENPLNYAYLDVMYLGYPLIHNADLIKDAAYYYPDFEIKEMANVIKHVVENFEDNIEEYRVKNSKVLERYTSDNELLLDSYRKLIHDLMNDVDSNDKYDWKTNSLEL